MVSLQGQAGYFVPMSVLSPMAPYGAAPGGGGKKRSADEMDGGKGGKGGKGWGDSKFPRPAVPNPGLDPQQQTFSGVMKGRLNMQTGYGFIQSDEVGMMYPGKDVFVHSKMCPWVESMTLEKDTKVQFQYVEKDGAPQCVRIVVLEGTTAGASAFTSFSAPMGGSANTRACRRPRRGQCGGAHNGVGVCIVVLPVGADVLLAADVPHVQLEPAVLH